MEIVQFAKNNWPLLAGGTVGLILIMRMRGGGGSAAPAPVYLNAGPSEASLMANAQLEAARLEAGILNRQVDMANNKQLAEIELQRKALEMQAAQNIEVARAANMTAAGTFLAAQGSSAGASGTAVSQMIGQLQQPAINAINSAANENAAALNAAAIVAMGSFEAQAASFSGVSDMIKNFLNIPTTAIQGNNAAALMGIDAIKSLPTLGEMAPDMSWLNQGQQQQRAPMQGSLSGMMGALGGGNSGGGFGGLF